MNTINTTLKTIVNALEYKKAEEIQLIDISGVSTIADYFVITNGINVSQIQALADNVEEKLTTNGIHPRSVEGYNTAAWILMDYNDILDYIEDNEISVRNFKLKINNILSSISKYGKNTYTWK